MDKLISFPLTSWKQLIDSVIQTKAVTMLENGCLILLPQLSFTLTPNELELLNPEYVDSRVKNISFKLQTHELKGLNNSSDYNATIIKKRLENLLKRFAKTTIEFMAQLFPGYNSALQIGRTSLRPVEIAERKNHSPRKDDSRLHVDAFPANPNQGQRILRTFSNINPDGKSRIWKLGEPFEQVAQHFLPHIQPPLPGSGWIFEKLNITKTCRAAYDHYMLQIHDRMKLDNYYQTSVNATTVELPANSSWLVYTDQVSHAALSGQHVLEQTFYLPVNAMQNPAKAPLKVLEKLLSKTLV